MARMERVPGRRSVFSNRVAVLMLVAVTGALLASCSDSSDRKPPPAMPSAPTAPTSTAPTSTEQPGVVHDAIRARVRLFYAFSGTGDWPKFWEMYSEGFKARCSFDDMVTYKENQRKVEGVVRAVVKDPIEVSAQQAVAEARYRVETFDARGSRVRAYDYVIRLKLEADGLWRFEEHCYQP